MDGNRLWNKDIGGSLIRLAVNIFKTFLWMWKLFSVGHGWYSSIAWYCLGYNNKKFRFGQIHSSISTELLGNKNRLKFRQILTILSNSSHYIFAITGFIDGEVHAYDQHGNFVMKVQMLCVENIEMETALSSLILNQKCFKIVSYRRFEKGCDCFDGMVCANSAFGHNDGWQPISCWRRTTKRWLICSQSRLICRRWK